LYFPVIEQQQMHNFFGTGGQTISSLVMKCYNLLSLESKQQQRWEKVPMPLFQNNTNHN
jgi:hypothetical protein